MNTNTKAATATIKQVVHRHILAVPDMDNVSATTVLELPANAKVTAVEFSKKFTDGESPKCEPQLAVFVLKTLGLTADKKRRFQVVRTGVEVPHSGEAVFVATASLPGIPAWHVFELLA